MPWKVLHRKSNRLQRIFMHNQMKDIFYCEALQEAMREEMQRDEGVFILGEDIGRMGGTFRATKGLLEQFGPERVIDT